MPTTEKAQNKKMTLTGLILFCIAMPIVAATSAATLWLVAGLLSGLQLRPWQLAFDDIVRLGFFGVALSLTIFFPFWVMVFVFYVLLSIELSRKYIPPRDKEPTRQKKQS